MSGLLFRNGPIYPMEGAPLGDAVLLVRDGRIEYVGPDEGLPAVRRADTRTIDLEGRPLLPGFCDSHLHLVLAAGERATLDLRGLRSVGELEKRVRERAAQLPAGAWLVGSGWERRLLFAAGEPSVAPLDRAAPHNPVFLVSKDLHSAWLSTAALSRFFALADRPRGCQPQRAGSGYSGVIYEEILELRGRLVPPPDRETRLASLGPYARHLWARGITTVHCHDAVGDYEIAREHLAASEQRVRVLWSFVLPSPDELRRSAGLFREALPGWLHTGGVKLFVDGTFGSLTAAVSLPYTDSDNTGILTMDAAELEAWVHAIREVGVYGVFHAIGDRAVQAVVEALDRVAWPAGAFHRIEHAQLLPEMLATRPRLDDLVFSVQPSHLWGDRELIERHLDTRLHERAYALATMQSRGATLLFGSDAPVEEVDPFRGIRAAVTRLEDASTPPFVPAQRLSMASAFRAYTSGPLRVHGAGFATGVLRPGCLADLVVLSADPFTAPRDAWDFGVEMTVLDGRVVFER